jgi:hypothetical protein
MPVILYQGSWTSKKNFQQKLPGTRYLTITRANNSKTSNSEPLLNFLNLVFFLIKKKKYKLQKTCYLFDCICRLFVAKSVSRGAKKQKQI